MNGWLAPSVFLLDVGIVTCPWRGDRTQHTIRLLKVRLPRSSGATAKAAPTMATHGAREGRSDRIGAIVLGKPLNIEKTTAAHSPPFPASKKP